MFFKNVKDNPLFVAKEIKFVHIPRLTEYFRNNYGFHWSEHGLIGTLSINIRFWDAKKKEKKLFNKTRGTIYTIVKCILAGINENINEYVGL